MQSAQPSRALAELEQAVLDQIDEGSVIEFHRQLVRVPSVNPPGDVREAFGICEQVMREGGFSTTSVSDLDEMPNLIAAHGDGGGPTLCFNAHLDVVPIGERSAWTRNPFGAQIHDGRVYGRGAGHGWAGVGVIWYSLERKPCRQ